MMSVHAAAHVVCQIRSEAQAIAVSMKAAGVNLRFVATALGVSIPQASRLKNGHRRMPDRLVQAFCNATGTNLLIQYRELQAAIEADSEAMELERLANMLREAA